MKNKKGFTLVELLVVIAIIGVLAIITIPTVIVSNNAAKTKAANVFGKSLSSAGETFVKEYPDIIYWEDNKDGTEFTCIAVKVLISVGYLEHDLIDPSTGELYDVNKMISVKRNKTTKTIVARNATDDELCSDFIYNKDKDGNGNGTGNGDDDDNNDNDNKITINYLLKISDAIYNEGTWTNQNITQYLSAESKNNIATFEISYNNRGSWTLITNPDEVLRSEDINGDVIVRAMDQYGNEAEVSYKLMIDKIPPTCTVNASGTLGSSSWYISNVSISMTYSDTNSGMNGYGLSTTNSAIYNSTSSLTLSTNTKSTTYYGFVIDKAGNTGTCNKTVKKADDSPSISLSCVPSSFTVGSSYTIPCIYDYGTSGAGSYSCTVSGTSYTNTKTLTQGSKTISCTITSANGKATTTTKTVSVTAASSGNCCPNCGEPCADSSCTECYHVLSGSTSSCYAGEINSCY